MQLIIYGAGVKGRQAYERIYKYYSGEKVLGFADSNKGGIYCGLPIIDLECTDIDKKYSDINCSI